MFRVSRVHGVLLAAWVALMAADRVNLLEEVVPFVFTPFIALTPLVIVSEWIRRSLAGTRVAITRGAVQYATVAAVLLAIVWASVTVAQSPTYSGSRAALLSAQVAGTWMVVVLALDLEDLIALLARASVVAVALHLVATFAQLGTIFGDVPLTVRVGTVALSLEPLTYGVIPRFTGLVGDATRAGMSLLVLGWFIAIGEQRPALRRTALVAVAVMLVATLSRSALLGAATTLALVALSRRKWELPVGSLVTASVLAVVLAGALYLAPAAPVRPFDALEPLAGRFSTSEASASEHVLFIGRGLDEATSSVQRFTMGLGYGNSFTVLQDRFPGNPYGNFHSLYVTMLVESGIAALLCVVVLLGWPVVRGGSWRPLIAGAAVLNVFYQTNAEPAFWFVLALAWIATEVPEAKQLRQG